MQASCRGFSGTGIAPLLVRSELFQLWEKRPDGVPHTKFQTKIGVVREIDLQRQYSQTFIIAILLVRMPYTWRRHITIVSDLHHASVMLHVISYRTVQHRGGEKTTCISFR